MVTLIKNIKKLLQTDETQRKWVAGKEMANLPVIDNAWLMIEDDRIVDFGSMDSCPEPDEASEIDVSGRIVMPTFCDSHTHLVYAGSREIEYGDKIRGLSYEEIAKKGGGILNSSKLLAQTTEEDLYEQALERIHEIIGFGTGAVEIKSGYGLDTENELKMLRVARRLKETTPIYIKTTFLGAHSIPMEYRNDQTKFVDKVINEMIPAVAAEELADYIDVFCDKGFFTVEDTERILMAGMKYGLIGKIHANELDYSGGIQVGVKYSARSVDHLEFVGPAEIKALQGSETMPTVLPGAAFFLNMKLSPVREMMNAGLPLALASDYNPGSSPSGNMKFIMSLGCINYKMTPEEVINATTLNSAYAMGLEDELGSISKGKIANLIITRPIPSYEYLPYAYTSHLVEQVMLNGELINLD